MTMWGNPLADAAWKRRAEPAPNTSGKQQTSKPGWNTYAPGSSSRSAPAKQTPWHNAARPTGANPARPHTPRQNTVPRTYQAKAKPFNLFDPSTWFQRQDRMETIAETDPKSVWLGAGARTTNADAVKNYNEGRTAGPYSSTQTKDQQQRASIEKAQQVASSRISSPGVQERMTQEAYDALSPDARAAVDFNGMLAQAIQKDKALGFTDSDKSGSISLKEARDATNRTGYSTAYQRIFGREADDNTTYAPNTMALLNTMDLRDKSGGDIREYLDGSGFVTSFDIERGSTRGAVQGPSLNRGTQNRQARDQLVTSVSDGMARLQKTLEDGRVALYGGRTQVTLRGVNDEQRSALVDSMRSALDSDMANGRFRMFGETEGISADVLIPEATRAKFATMEQALAAADEAGAPLEDLTNPDALREIGFGRAGATASISPEEFAEYVKDRKGMNSGAVGETLESSVEMDRLTGNGG